MRFGLLHLTLCRYCLGSTGEWATCWSCRGHAMRTVATVAEADLVIALEWTGSDLRLVLEPTERFRGFLDGLTSDEEERDRR